MKIFRFLLVLLSFTPVVALAQKPATHLYWTGDNHVSRFNLVTGELDTVFDAMAGRMQLNG